jgi:hypothetical protein
MPATVHNRDGFWEHLRFVEVNDELLNELGGGWDSPVSSPGPWANDARLIPVRNKAESVVAEFIDHHPWGWKDPRNSVTLPFWQAVAGPLKVVLCVRNPLEVALSLRSRNFFSYSLSLSLWKTYNERVLEATSSADRFVTHYDAYFDDPQSELRRLLEFAELDVSPGARDACASIIASRLRHHRFTSDHLAAVEIAPGLADLYQRLCVEAGRQRDAAALAARATVHVAASAAMAVSTSDGGFAVELAGFPDAEAWGGHRPPVRQVNAFVIDLLRQLDDLRSSMAAKGTALAAKDATIRDKESTIAVRDAALAELQRERDDLRSSMAAQAAAIAARGAALAAGEVTTAATESTIAVTDVALARLQRECDALRSALSEKDAALAARDATIAAGTVAIGAQDAAMVELRAVLDEQARGLRAGSEELTRQEQALRQLEEENSAVRRELGEERDRRRRLEAAAGREYEHLKRRLFGLIDETVPPRATVWMVSRGDESLIRLNGRRTGHFPQTPQGIWAGHHPADSAAAIAQLEALRVKGSAFLVFPATSQWWLEHYADFRAYLQTRCRTVADREDTGIIFEVPDLAWRRRLDAAIARFQKRFGKDPAILDWNSGLELAAVFPDATVFAPPEAASTLPYLDRSVDIVVCPRTPEAVREARRVASAMVVTIGRSRTNGKGRRLQSVSGVSLQRHWIVGSAPRRAHARSSAAGAGRPGAGTPRGQRR